MSFEIQKASRFKSIHAFYVSESDFNNKDLFGGGQFSYLFDLGRSSTKKIVLIFPFSDEYNKIAQEIDEYVVKMLFFEGDIIMSDISEQAQQFANKKRDQTKPLKNKEQTKQSRIDLLTEKFSEFVQTNFKETKSYKISNLYVMFMLHSLFNNPDKTTTAWPLNMLKFKFCLCNQTSTSGNSLRSYYGDFLKKNAFRFKNNKKAFKILFNIDNASKINAIVSTSHGIIKDLMKFTSKTKVNIAMAAIFSDK